MRKLKNDMSTNAGDLPRKWCHPAVPPSGKCQVGVKADQGEVASEVQRSGVTSSMDSES